MEFEPTIETLQWIVNNAEKAWRENDFRALQYWEEQKQRLNQKAQEKLKSIYHSLDLIVQQQEALIEKVQRGEYTTIEANRINNVLYEHREQLLIELHRYREFLDYYKTLSKAPISDKSSPVALPGKPLTQPDVMGGEIEKEKLRKIIPRFQFSDLLNWILIKPVMRLLLSASFHVIVLFLVILGLMFFSGIKYMKDAQVKMYVEAKNNVYSIRFENNAFWSARIALDSTSAKGYSPTIYLLKIYLVDSQGKRNLVSNLISCMYTDLGPITRSYLELTRGAEIKFYIDVSCLSNELLGTEKIEVVFESKFPRRILSSETINVS